MKTTTIRLPDDLHKQIRHQALEADISMNTWILRALELEAKKEDNTMKLKINEMKIYAADRLVKFNDGSFQYFDSYGDETEFSSSDALYSWLSENQIAVEDISGLEYFIEE